MVPVKSILAASLVAIVTLVFVFPWNNSCSGNAVCISGEVTEILDGDTIKIDDMFIQLTLISTPEIDQIGGKSAKEYIQQICPVGSTVLVDEDDGHVKGSFDNMVALVYCNGKILNEEIILNEHGEIPSQFCASSEFSNMIWASQNGC